MKIITGIAEARQYVGGSTKRRVLVPTMGALHRGHLELVRIARGAAGNDGEIVLSIFVNPLQFAPGGDFEKYPRPTNADESACRDAGVDLVFRPTVAEMYAADRSIFVEEIALSRVMEGKSRPGHFRGVCTVVAKLFNILAPHAAVFGEKDFQQLAIIRRLVRDLSYPVEIIGAPTMREDDGLACSSRNQYLNAEERKQAAVLHKALSGARDFTGSAREVLARVRQTIGEAPLARIDYVELVDADTLEPIQSVRRNSLLAVAVFFGHTRLIDNMRLR
ncbi:MAG: pantoate--beta-alanine ligase [Chthoniobacterales bacterium]